MSHSLKTNTPNTNNTLVTIMATTTTTTTTSTIDQTTIITDLQRQLASLQQERDDLARDVEALCISGADPSGISSSSVVSERIRIQDEQLADHRARLASAIADAASLREDNTALRDSKRVADQGWRTESQRAAELERELQFYQTQSARAMSDRDRATWEADELRRRVDDLEQALERERGLLIAEQGQRQQAEAEGASAQEQIAALRVELKGLDVVPGLRATIARLESETQQLQESLGSVQEQLARRVEEIAGLERRVEEMQGQVQSARDGNARLEKKLTSAKEKHAAEVFQLQVCCGGGYHTRGGVLHPDVTRLIHHHVPPTMCFFHTTPWFSIPPHSLTSQRSPMTSLPLVLHKMISMPVLPLPMPSLKHKNTRWRCTKPLYKEGPRQHNVPSMRLCSRQKKHMRVWSTN